MPVPLTQLTISTCRPMLILDRLHGIRGLGRTHAAAGTMTSLPLLRGTKADSRAGRPFLVWKGGDHLIAQ